MEKKSNIIPLKEKIIYGAGDICGGGSSTLISVALLVYLNKVLGIPTVFASTIFLISKIFDAVSDPLMGIISDNCRLKFGRRKPFLILGGILLFISMLLLFAPIKSDNLIFKILYVLFSYLFYCVASTVAQVPYSSLSSDISSDHKERNKANTFKLIFSMSSSAVCYLIPSFAIESLLNNTISHTTFYLIIAVGFGLLFALTLILAGVFTKERVEYDKNKKSRFNLKSYLAPFKVKSFNYHLGMYISLFVCMDIISALAVYYATDVMKDVTVLGMKMSSVFIIAPMTLAVFLTLPLVLKIAKKKSKQFALRAGLPLYCIGGLALAFMPTTVNGILIPIAAFIMGVGFAGAQSMPWMIFPDTIDLAQLKYKSRDTGSFSGIMTFLRKLSNAFAIWIVGIFLTIGGEIPGSNEGIRPIQPDSLLLTVRILLGSSIIILVTIAFIYSKKYKVTYEDLNEVKRINELVNNKIELDETTKLKKKELLNKLVNK